MQGQSDDSKSRNDDKEGEDRHRRHHQKSRRKEKKRTKKEERRREKKNRKRDRTSSGDNNIGNATTREEGVVATRTTADDRRKASSSLLSSSTHGKRRKVDQIEIHKSKDGKGSEKRERVIALTTSHTPSSQQLISEDTTTRAPSQTSVRKNMAPMSKAEWEARHQQVQTVIDPITGRIRTMRATGEIIESIVSRSQHQAINQMATRGDGQSFSRQIYHEGRRRR